METSDTGLVAYRNIFNLPPLCYVHIAGQPIGHHIGIVKLGEGGYYPAPGMTIAAADAKNHRMKVSHAQREAMHIGSMFGWHVPGVNPLKYEGKAGPIATQPLVDAEIAAILARPVGEE